MIIAIIILSILLLMSLIVIFVSKQGKQNLVHGMYEQGKFDAIAKLQMEGKIVIDTDEYKQLKQHANKVLALVQEVVTNARKETAKDFIFKVESYLGYNDDNETFTKKELLLILAEVAKEQYGVEVDE